MVYLTKSDLADLSTNDHEKYRVVSEGKWIEGHKQQSKEIIFTEDDIKYYRTAIYRYSVGFNDWEIEVSCEKTACPEVTKTYELKEVWVRTDKVDAQPSILEESDYSKYLVMKMEDVLELPDDLRKGARMASQAIYAMRYELGKKTRNRYLVINTDESYAPAVASIMKAHGHWGNNNK